MHKSIIFFHINCIIREVRNQDGNVVSIPKRSNAAIDDPRAPTIFEPKHFTVITSEEIKYGIWTPVDPSLKVGSIHILIDILYIVFVMMFPHHVLLESLR